MGAFGRRDWGVGGMLRGVEVSCLYYTHIYGVIRLKKKPPIYRFASITFFQLANWLYVTEA